jgi:hypothetical protein
MDSSDPRAMRSRGDLRRVHRVMRTVSILKHAIDRLQLAGAPRSILELGGGDATLLLRFARLQPQWSQVSLTVLDNQDVISAETRKAYSCLGWELQVIRRDAVQWASGPGAAHYDLCLTNLFLHHFDGTTLATLMRGIARDCDALVACEPRRNTFSLLASKAIGLMGANYITRHDAVTSVIAGFAGRELCETWPRDLRGWTCQEYAVFPFAHCFAAVRDCARSPVQPP